MSAELGRSEGVADLRHKTQQRLKHDEEKLKFYQENVKHLSKTTDRMENLLSGFLQRLEDLQQSIDPVHTETSVLTRARDNIDQVSQLLSSVEGHYRMSHVAEQRIARGPSYHLQQYIDTVKDIADAIAYFEEHNPNNPELSKLRHLRQKAHDALIREFSEVLERHSLPLGQEELTLLLDRQAELIAAGTPPHQAPLASTSLSPEIAITLKTLAEWMIITTSHAQECIDLTAKIRCGPAELALGAFTLDSRPATPMSRGRQGLASTPVRAAKRVQGVLNRTSSILRKSRVDSLRRHSQMLGSPSKVGQPEAEQVATDVYEKGTEPVLDFLDVCLALLRHEYAILKSFLPRRHLANVLSEVADVVVDTLLRRLRDVLTAAGASNSQRQFFSALVVFDVLQRMHELSSYYAAVLDETNNSHLRRQLFEAMHDAADLGRRVLLSFQNCITKDPATEKLPEDGTVHELTSRGMKFIISVLDFQEAAASVLVRNQHESGDRDLTWISGAKARAAAANWVLSVLTALKNNLELKARTYEEPAIINVFLMNNFSYIVTSLKRFAFEKYITEETRNEMLRTYEELVETAKDLYLSSTWDRLLSALKVEPVSTPLAKREKDMIKERYTTFNEELERIQALQQEFTIPNKTLRDALTTANVELVVPRFAKFNAAYSTSGFSQKNPHKYLRHSTEDVGRMLKALLGGEE